MHKTSDDADEPIYKMKGLGKFVIISQGTFLPRSNKKTAPKPRNCAKTKKLRQNKETAPKPRNCAKKDAELLERCFSSRGFNIFDRHFDKTVKDIKNIVENLKVSDEDSVFGLFLGTHGKRGGKIHATDGKMNIREIILPICEKLPKEIPKIFFIQACRGGQGMTTHEESKGNDAEENKENDAEENKENDAEENEENDAEENEENDAEENKENDAEENKENDAEENKENDAEENKENDAEENKENDAEENKGNDAEENKKKKDIRFELPPHVLLVRSTVEGYVSFRNSEGSWMVQDITKAFGNYPFKEVITIITRANNALSDRIANYTDPKKKEKEEKEEKERKERKRLCQVMSITSKLQKDLFLLPPEQ